jgi:hypothetical protein
LLDDLLGPFLTASTDCGEKVSVAGEKFADLVVVKGLTNDVGHQQLKQAALPPWVLS